MSEVYKDDIQQKVRNRWKELVEELHLPPNLPEPEVYVMNFAMYSFPNKIIISEDLLEEEYTHELAHMAFHLNMYPKITPGDWKESDTLFGYFISEFFSLLVEGLFVPNPTELPYHYTKYTVDEVLTKYKEARSIISREARSIIRKFREIETKLPVEIETRVASYKEFRKEPKAIPPKEARSRIRKFEEIEKKLSVEIRYRLRLYRELINGNPYYTSPLYRLISDFKGGLDNTAWALARFILSHFGKKESWELAREIIEEFKDKDKSQIEEVRRKVLSKIEAKIEEAIIKEVEDKIQAKIEEALGKK